MSKLQEIQKRYGNNSSECYAAACAMLWKVTRKCALPIRKGGGNIRNVSEELIAHVTKNEGS